MNTDEPNGFVWSSTFRRWGAPDSASTQDTKPDRLKAELQAPSIGATLRSSVVNMI